MQIPVERVREIIKISQEPVSLETPIGEEEDSHLGDFIQDENVPVPADAAAYTMLKEQLKEVLGTLTVREQKVLRLRFGLDDGRARTLEEVGLAGEDHLQIVVAVAGGDGLVADGLQGADGGKQEAAAG